MSQNREYNITDNVNDGVKFDIRGKKFFLRYPLVDEVEELQRLADELQTSEKSEDESVRQEKSKQLESYIYNFVDPIEHDTPIKEALSKENIIALRNFNRMIKTEFSVEV